MLTAKLAKDRTRVLCGVPDCGCPIATVDHARLVLPPGMVNREGIWCETRHAARKRDHAGRPGSRRWRVVNNANPFVAGSTRAVEPVLAFRRGWLALPDRPLLIRCPNGHVSRCPAELLDAPQ